MLLADVFEHFRDSSLEPQRFLLDPAHYVSAPQMAWDAMLKTTGVELDLISDPAMYLMIESGMRGGVCMISKRHAIANNKYMGALYKPNEPSKYIYLDANNLYGWAMKQALPEKNFKRRTADDIAHLELQWSWDMLSQDGGGWGGGHSRGGCGGVARGGCRGGGGRGDIRCARRGVRRGTPNRTPQKIPNRLHPALAYPN